MASADLPLASLDDRQRAAAQHAAARWPSSPARARARPESWSRAWRGSSPRATRDPGEICALTFMNDSAREIAERLERALGADRSRPDHGRNQPPNGQRLLRGCAARFARHGRYSIWDTEQARRALTQALAASADVTAPPSTVGSWPRDAAQRLQLAMAGRRQRARGRPRGRLGRDCWPTSTPSAPRPPSTSTTCCSTPRWRSSPTPACGQLGPTLALRAARRGPGHQRRAVPDRLAAGRRAPQPDDPRRPRPGDLRLPRRHQRGELRRLRARVPRARGRRPSSATTARRRRSCGRQRAHRRQPRSHREAAVDHWAHR